MSAQRSGKKPEEPTNVEGIRVTESLDILDQLDLRLLKERTVVINDDIDQWVAGKLTRMFQFLALEPKPITLLISSDGGLLEAGFTILRAMQHAREGGCELIGEVRGCAMSMAAIVLQHCDLRYASPDDIIMIHGATSQPFGPIRNQKEEQRLVVRFMETWAHLLAERNTSEDPQYKDQLFWVKWLEDDFPHYFFGHEAFTAGLIDGVLI